MGCGTVTKHMSVSPWLFCVPRARATNWSVTIVTVGNAHLFEIALVNYQP